MRKAGLQNQEILDPKEQGLLKTYLSKKNFKSYLGLKNIICMTRIKIKLIITFN